jgi:hypothetical protein
MAVHNRLAARFSVIYFPSCTCRNRKLLLTTNTELNAIAPAAMIGLSCQPKNGYSTPAAIGMPIIL